MSGLLSAQESKNVTSLPHLSSFIKVIIVGGGEVESSKWELGWKCQKVRVSKGSNGLREDGLKIKIEVKAENKIKTNP